MRRARAAGAAGVATLALLAIGIGTTGNASANSGADFCVTTTAPVHPGPSTDHRPDGHVHVHQAWHEYGTTGNYTYGYVSRTDPVLRGYVPLGYLDHSRTPVQDPGGGASCPN